MAAIIIYINFSISMMIIIVITAKVTFHADACLLDGKCMLATFQFQL